MGLVARVVEEMGIPTVYVGTGRDLTKQVMPPRSMFLNFPMGNPFGRPQDVEMQTKILREAMELATTATSPGEMVDMPYDWGEDFLTIMELKAGYSAQAPDPETGKQRI